MHGFQPGDRVHANGQGNKVATIVAHHPNLPAWVVQWPNGERLAYLDTELARA